MERSVNIGGREIHLRMSALVPRLYRFHTGRDLISDMRRIEKSQKQAVEQLEPTADADEQEAARMAATDMTIFEDLSYIMAKHAGEELPSTVEEWLAEMDGPTDFYRILPVALELWRLDQESTSTAIKK